MHLTEENPFDTIAATYDASFSQSRVGEQQRFAVRKNMLPFLKDKYGLKILEINCGTGDDALWLASLGHDVIATDASVQMIEMAKKKASMATTSDKICFLQCPFEKLYSLCKEQSFDVIFSNFSGLNCISSGELQILNNDLSALLKHGGYFAVILFGKYTCWETLFYLLHLNFKHAFRRWSSKGVKISLNSGTTQTVYYYSIGKFKGLLNHFQLLQKKPVGLFIPPSYLDNLIVKKPRIFQVLIKLEQKFSNVGLFSSFSDHTFLLFKKKVL